MIFFLHPTTNSSSTCYSVLYLLIKSRTGLQNILKNVLVSQQCSIQKDKSRNSQQFKEFTSKINSKQCSQFYDIQSTIFHSCKLDSKSNPKCNSKEKKRCSEEFPFHSISPTAAARIGRIYFSSSTRFRNGRNHSSDWSHQYWEYQSTVGTE